MNVQETLYLEWDFVKESSKELLGELEVVATAFIKEKLAELDSPAEFGFRSVAFKDEFIFITRNDDSHVFECFVGW
jgi:hypothetical protein